MASVKNKIQAEIENIEKILAELEKVKKKPRKELVVLVGIGAFLQNIYTGIENILKQMLLHQNASIPETPTWHKDLLNLAVENKFISLKIVDKIGKYLVFRHFFTHSYGFLIDEEKLKPLINNISDIYFEFKKEVIEYLSKVKE